MQRELPYTPFTTGERIRIAFLFQSPSYWAGWESFYGACIGDACFDVRMLSYCSQGGFKLDAAERFLSENSIPFTKFNSSLISEWKPHIFVLQTPYDEWHRRPSEYSSVLREHGCRIVYIPYGIEFPDTHYARLCHFHTFPILNAWRIYVLSDSMKAEYHKHCPNRNAVKPFGHPRFDAYANKDRFRLPESMESTINGRKVILWKIHFPRYTRIECGCVLETPDINEYLKFAASLSKYRDLFFIFMPHPNLLSGQYPEQFILQIESLVATIDKSDNAFIDTDADYRPSLLRSDAIIIDRSALMVEAGIIGKPILYMTNPEYPEIISPAVAPLIKSYCHGSSVDDMTQFLERFLKGFDLNKARHVDAFHKCVPYTDGKCGKRIAKDIATGLLQEQKTDNVLRVALFGLGDTFHYYIKHFDLTNREDMTIIALSDNNESFRGKEFYGIKVVEPVKLRDYDFDFIVVFSECYYRDILKQLIFDFNINMDKVLRLDHFISKINRIGEVGDEV